MNADELIFARRILAADDDPILCRLISDFLVKDGFAVDTVSDGEQAWDALQHGHYDLLVTDNEMPHLTGVKLIERMRQAGMSLPVIMASTSFSVDSVRECPQLQIAAVVPKPFRRFELLNAVKTILPECGIADTEHGSPNKSQAGPPTKRQRPEPNLNLCHH